MPTAARILWKGSASPIQQVFEPSGFSCSVASVGMKVVGRWCCGQLNSTPPDTHGPASPTMAGLMQTFL